MVIGESIGTAIIENQSKFLHQLLYEGRNHAWSQC